MREGAPYNPDYVRAQIIDHRCPKNLLSRFWQRLSAFSRAWQLLEILLSRI
jgi:hypothetical protein